MSEVLVYASRGKCAGRPLLLRSTEVGCTVYGDTADLFVYRNTKAAWTDKICSTANLQQPYLVLEFAEPVLWSWVMHRQQNFRNLCTYSSTETPDEWIYASDFLHQKFPNQKKELFQEILAACKPKGVAYM